MYLDKLIILNYRSCRCVDLDLCRDEPNILIGINDCGKTSLLKGLELLLSEKPQVFCIKDGTRKKDASNSMFSVDDLAEKCNGLGIPVLPYTGSEILVIGKFLIDPEDFNDLEIQQLKNHSLWVLENSVSSGIWYARSFDSDGKCRHFLLTPDVQLEDDTYHGFYNMTSAQLNRKKTELALTNEEIQNDNGVGRFSNLEIVRALYSRLGSAPYWIEWRWEKHLLPSFRYLDWNSSFDNILESATEALKELIEEHLAPIKSQARIGALAAQTVLNERLEMHRAAISSVVPQVQTLTANIHFDVKEKITDLLVRKIGSDDEVHMDLQGDGIKRQIWFALIKAAASTADGADRKRHIWAFDEPETHLYPTAQRQLFEVIKELSSGAIQTFISTHSTVFIDKVKLSSIRLVSQYAGYTSHSSCETVDDIFNSLELRNSDFLFYDKFLVVEGETEEHLIPGLYFLYTGKKLADDNVQLIKLGGASNWLTQKSALEGVFTGFNKPTENTIYLFDNDQRYELGASAITDNMFFVGKQDIEDDLPNHIWSAIASSVYEGNIDFTIEEIEALKLKVPVGRKASGKNEKFFEILKAAIRKKAMDLDLDMFAEIPTKGQELASAILERMGNRNEIPIKMQECFDRIATVSNRSVTVAESDLEEAAV